MLHHPRRDEPEVDKGIYPLWKHGQVMAMYKPGNLPMHESGPYRKNTFSHILSEEFGKEWAAVHRLDRETSGIVLCGRTHEIRSALSAALADRNVGKEYLAFSKGDSIQDSFREIGPIGELRGSTIRIKKWVVPDGLPSETFFEVLERKKGHVFMKALPKTGRTNQIRVHAAYNSLPLVGDKLYHPDADVFDEYFRNRGNTNRILQETGFHRLCLHAHKLKFIHPETGRFCEVVSQLPEDMKTFWDSL